jgi:hypothetical protein
MGCVISVTSDFLMSSDFEQNSPLLPDELIMQTAARWKMIDKPVVLAENVHPIYKNLVG